VVLPAHGPASREVDVMRPGRIALKLIGHARALRRAASDRRERCSLYQAPTTLRRFGPSRRKSSAFASLKLSLIGSVGSESPDRLAIVTFSVLDLIFAGDAYTVPTGSNHSFFSLY
jgi:hypothetical protein